jgi:trehalose 6-phosphate synthase
MRPVIRFAVILVVGLGFVAALASILFNNTARTWFENDVRLRAEIAVRGARAGFVEYWGARRLQSLLVEMTHDERILSAAACSPDLHYVARTENYPEELRCSAVGPKVHDAQGKWLSWSEPASLPGGDVYVSAIPIADDGKTLGFVVVVHDLSFIARREARTREFLFVVFGFLALAASAVTIIAARVAARSWSNQLRKMLRGEAEPEETREFQPILGDVRQLLEELVAEKESEAETGTWTAERLKQTLNRYLRGERIMIVANREPYLHQRKPDGSIVAVHPASGLVTALEPIMRACSGVWIGHGSGSADRETADKDGHVRVPPGEETYVIRRVWLNKEEEQGYYYGFSNEGLWPLCHNAHTRPIFRADDWERYKEVNAKFVDAVCAEADREDPVVLVQDYHFALVPRLMRERLPRATIIMFWHIPWPNSERLGICPWGNEILEGMLGASIVGFHTRFDCNNFVDCVDRFLEARIDREQNAVVQQGRSTLIRPYPISVEWPPQWMKTVPTVADCRRSVIEELGLARDALIGVGVDRLDYTKGVEERLLAVERLLERFPAYRGRFTFVQLAAPSRTEIERYKDLNETVNKLGDRINARFGKDNYRPIVLLTSHHQPPTVFRYYRAADVCYVSSLHDGMNLVAKEFVAARDDERGVLVLSQFTGASRELSEALVVNPYDLEEASSAMAAALSMSPMEQRDRMRSMRAFVAEFNVYRWAGRMLVDAGRLRKRDRISWRLTHHLASAAVLRP